MIALGSGILANDGQIDASIPCCISQTAAPMGFSLQGCATEMLTDGWQGWHHQLFQHARAGTDDERFGLARLLFAEVF